MVLKSTKSTRSPEVTSCEFSPSLFTLFKLSYVFSQGFHSVVGILVCFSTQTLYSDVAFLLTADMSTWSVQ